MRADTRLGIVLAAALLVAACNKGRKTGDECAFEPLPAGATLIYRGGGGLKAQFVRFTVFDDGRVESGKDSALRRGRVPVARVEKLKADVAATGALNEKDACWVPSKQQDDFYFASMVMRASGNVVHSYTTQEGASPPPAIDRALDIAAKFGSEVRPLLEADAAVP